MVIKWNQADFSRNMLLQNAFLTMALAFVFVLYPFTLIMLCYCGLLRRIYDAPLG